jgi:perosamine synthetase
MSQSFIPISEPSIGSREEELVLAAVRSGWVSSIGEYIDRLESVFANFCSVKHAIAVSNGTTALHLALASLGIGPGDEVIVPDLTFVATANAVAYLGATPVLADVEPDTLCISPSSIAKNISTRTKAVIPVHLYGHPADMDEIQNIATTSGIKVVEDAAEAHGAEYKSRRVGGLSDCAIFSFYGNKIVTTGEGGVLTTNDDSIASKARHLRDHAMSKQRRYWHDELGFNYRMTNLQAALGVAQMERIKEFIEKRAEIMQWYRELLDLTETVRLNATKNWAKSVYWMVCLEVDWFDEIARDRFMQELRTRGIDTRPYFCTLSSMPMYAQVPLPIAARKSQIGLNLPCYFKLSRIQVERIAREVNSVLDEMRPQ